MPEPKPRPANFHHSSSLLQSRHIKRQAEALCIRNQEVQRSCEELLDLVRRLFTFYQHGIAGGCAEV